MPRRPKPPACPRRSLLRAKARREAVALAADLRAEAKALASLKRRAAREAGVARAAQADALARRYDAAMARAPAPLTSVSARIQGRAEMAERERWRALGIELTN